MATVTVIRIKMELGNSPETVTEPLYTFEEVCKLNASKLVSPFSTKYLTASQLSPHLTKPHLRIFPSLEFSLSSLAYIRTIHVSKINCTSFK